MSDFMEECRKEWRRLGVPDGAAAEMAAELAADPDDAAADGVAAEELLGRAASDPRSFAASWATERGLVPEPPSGAARRRPRVLVAFTIVAAAVLVASAALLATGEPKVSLVTLGSPPASVVAAPPGRVTASAAAPIEWVLLAVAIAAVAFAVWLWSRWARSQPPAALRV
ncbi:MAG: hypothetical protein ABUS54_11415 [Actinomycetota bacterium]